MKSTSGVGMPCPVGDTYHLPSESSKNSADGSSKPTTCDSFVDRRLHIHRSFGNRGVVGITTGRAKTRVIGQRGFTADAFFHGSVVYQKKGTRRPSREDRRVPQAEPLGRSTRLGESITSVSNERVIQQLASVPKTVLCRARYRT